MDAIDLLKRDHRTIEWIFDAYDGTVSAEQRRALVERLVTDLDAHADIENTAVYPLAAEMELDDVAGSRAEHMAMRRTLDRLGQLAAGDAAEGPLVAQLRREIDYHVRKEETELLPALWASLDAAAMEQLTRQVQEARAPGAAEESADAAGTMPQTILVGRRTGILGRLRGRSRGGAVR